MTNPSLFDNDAEYLAFCEKFVPKKTTDDCYTPEPVYNEIRDYVCERYGVDPAKIVRPFWPNADYRRVEYPDGCVVLDNPPFSIVSQIVKFYRHNGIRFFLFVPGLTPFSALHKGTTVLCCGVSIVYENGVKVNTSFAHNLDGVSAVESCPELFDRVTAVCDALRKKKTKTVANIELPPEVISAAKINWYTKYHTPFQVRHGEFALIRGLDNYPKGVFGAGLLLAERAAAERAAAERAAAERAAAERIELSPREREIQRMIGR